ncbi:helix-turn-helix domain-containing protein [Actinomadura rubrisoli]|uniref:helix-turn-helix domain-containing protein n=1 Tax=Actinomadura rubrisoli TaxID=2530368 RepID=UPI00140558B5|nr:DUF5753 domain-containing protein [Actinomadura rubrisoli]
MSEPYEAPAIVTFARELQFWRTNAGLNKKQLADALGFTDSYVGQVELCKNIPSEEFAEALDTYFKTNGLFGRLRERILETRQYSVIPPGFPEYLKCEHRAESLKNFNPTLVNGILQTEDYARAILGTNQSPDVAEELVQERMKRKEVLDRAHGYFVMDEAALNRIVGSPEIMLGQFRFFLDLMERPRIQLEVVPSTTGFYPGLGGEFYILGFEDGSSVVYTESSGEGLLIQDPVRIARHVLRYDSLRGRALPVDQSRTLIRRAIERLEA